MQRVTWAPMGAGGTVLHAIAVLNTGGETAISLCGYHEPLLTAEPGMKPCANCQETLKALVDTMPPNATV
ncbi:MAG: hypothetical protein H0U61_14810 [Nocardioidaceae bacterium]|nr:hypothetical protein [Nocardioidaceae bacterium]